MTPFRTEHLANGVVLDFFDLSNRYFGDYHRICVEVRIRLPLTGKGPHNVTRLERMGVAGADVTLARDRLVADYWRHAGRYLARPDFPARLAASNAKSVQPGAKRPGTHAR
jgi:hypothetical protein